jgi:hypothetical protein
MKSTTSALSAPFVLKVVGYVLLLFALTDYVALFWPMKWQDDQWLGGTLIQLVDRGTTALIALAMIYVSSFLDSGSLRAEGRSPFATGRFFAMVLSGILGLAFLVTVPVQFINTNKVATTAIDRIAKQTQQQEQQLAGQVQQRLGQLQEQVKDKAKLEAELKQIDEIVKTGQLNGQKIEPAQLEFIKKSQKDLQKLKDDPNYLQVMAKEASDQELQKVRETAKKTEEQARSEASRTSLKTGLSSLWLSIGFTIISWLGLAEMGIFSKR